MNANEGVFRALLAVALTLAALTLPLFLLQEPGMEGYVVSLLSLVVQSGLVAIALAGLYFGWKPFSILETE